MKRLLLAAIALIVVGSLAGSLAYTVALAQDGTKPAASKPAASKPAAPKPAAVKTDRDGRPVSNKSAAARAALCKADCLPNNYKECPTWGCTGMHGLYRSYNQNDPQLKSIEGQKQFAQCVKACVDPLPAIYVQRPLLASGGKWFGKSREDCLQCHAKAH
jgi:hypothetical protein